MAFPDWLAGQLITADDLNDRQSRTIYKAAQESVTSSTTLQDDNDFVFELEANTIYTLESYLIYSGVIDGGTGAGGLKLQFTGPTGATANWTNFGANTGSVAAVTQYNVVAEALSAGAPRSVPTNAAVTMTCQPKGVVVTAGTAGDLTLRWAQNTSNATPTIMHAYSWMRLKKVA